MASFGSPNTEPCERFERSKPTGPRRAATSPSDTSSGDDDEPGGVRLEPQSAPDSPVDQTTPVAATNGFARARAVDDVFGSPAEGEDDSTDNNHVDAATERINAAARAAGENALANSMAVIQLRARASNTNSRHQINGVDAQAIHPPSSCVFVANLAETKDDIALEAALTEEFQQYGVCYIKIRRDANHLPFAFVQYTNDAEAQAAHSQSAGAVIFGRACRTEWVKANRVFVIMRRRNPAITIEEAKNVMGPFGDISKAEMLHPTIRERLGYPQTVQIEFASFDPARDLNSFFRDEDNYFVSAFDVKKNDIKTRKSCDEEYLADVERNRRSIFIGDLPAVVDEADLRAMFGQAGDILHINIVERPAINSARHNSNGVSATGLSSAIAFIEYSQPDAPDTAMAMFHGTVYKNHGSVRIRVERKLHKTRGPRARNTSRNFPSSRHSNVHNPMANIYTPARGGPSVPNSSFRRTGGTTQQQQQQASHQQPQRAQQQYAQCPGSVASQTPSRVFSTHGAQYAAEQSPYVAQSPYVHVNQTPNGGALQNMMHGSGPGPMMGPLTSTPVYAPTVANGHLNGMNDGGFSPMVPQGHYTWGSAQGHGNQGHGGGMDVTQQSPFPFPSGYFPGVFHPGPYEQHMAMYTPTMIGAPPIQYPQLQHQHLLAQQAAAAQSPTPGGPGMQHVGESPFVRSSTQASGGGALPASTGSRFKAEVASDDEDDDDTPTPTRSKPADNAAAVASGDKTAAATREV